MIHLLTDVNNLLGQTGLYERGVDLLQQGKLIECTRALEAEVQQHADNSDAWLVLGLAHAENDEDLKAIIALNRAVEADDDSLDALLALGVSHTNELEQSSALLRLRTWITRHPEYRSQPSTLNPQPSTLNPQPSTLNPQPSTLNPQPSTLNPSRGSPDTPSTGGVRCLALALG
jgi:hypothetical protein